MHNGLALLLAVNGIVTLLKMMYLPYLRLLSLSDIHSTILDGHFEPNTLAAT